MCVCNSEVDLGSRVSIPGGASTVITTLLLHSVAALGINLATYLAATWQQGKKMPHVDFVLPFLPWDQRAKKFSTTKAKENDEEEEEVGEGEEEVAAADAKC